MSEMEELKRDMEREEKFQKFRHNAMSFCAGGGVAIILASAHDWRQLVTAVVITAIAELTLWLEG